MPRSKDPTPPRANPYYLWGACGLLLLLIGLVYGQTLDHPLLDYDDNTFVSDNPLVRAGFTGKGIRWALTEGPFGEWYPLAVLSHMLDCQLFGLSAWGHHLTGVLLHAATAIGLFLVLRRMTDGFWPSALVAAVFAVHPQHVESVAWVAERKDVLSGLFFVLTLAAWLGYVRQGRPWAWYLLAAVFFALGLMAKPMIVTLPPLLLLLDFWPLARVGAAGETPRWTQTIDRPGLLRLVLEKLPLVAIAAGDCLMTLRTHATGAVVAPWRERIGNAAVSCVDYVFGFFYPVDLAAFYPLPPGGPPGWKVAAAATILAVASVAAVIWRRRCPYCFVGWFWYLGMVFPVLGVVNIGTLAMADRYTYLPSIGLCIAVAWGAKRLAAGSPGRRWLLGACAALAVAVLACCAGVQASYWRDDETLWRHALACTTDNAKAEYSMANVLARQGRRDAAIVYYRRAQQHGADPLPYNNLGLLLAQQGRLREAVAQYRQALAIDADSYMAHNNLGTALARQNQGDEARKHFRRALQINPRSATAHCGLAGLLLAEERIDEARVELKRAIELDPYSVVAHYNLGSTFLEQGDADAAIPHLETALSIQPNYTLAHINLARAFAIRGQSSQAVTHYRRALAIEPNNAEARDELDRLLRADSRPSRP
ncbi:MAG TPA: tetratricopeptide repeat protein [Pirellulales bacterium]|jgi:tetratricopeptide (TPR) repeat protein|nr:tetratricopeptide repeat protein [Pirellulales bacterium]